MIYRKWSLLTGPPAILGSIVATIVVANLLFVNNDTFRSDKGKKEASPSTKKPSSDQSKRIIQENCNPKRATKFLKNMLIGLQLELSRGCPNLQKLELKACSFSECALSLSVMQLTSLRYLWVQGYVESQPGRDFLDMVRPYWIIGSIPPRRVVHRDRTILDHPDQILAYYSLARR